MCIVHDHRSSRDESPTLDRSSLVYFAAQADARNCSRDAIEAGISLFREIVNDPEADPFEVFNAAERLRAFTEEIGSRDRVARLATGTATRNDRSSKGWNALRDIVKERVEVPDILILAGLPMTRTGSSRGRQEWHGPCPKCRDGVDRLMAWSGPYGRVWCRECGWSGDVVSAASLIAGPEFRDCLRHLADHAGIPAPEPYPAPKTIASAGSFEFRGGKVVSR